MTHEEHKEAVALAALGEELEPERHDALEVHLAACGECRAELRALSDAAAMLALSPAPVSPSPELRSRVLAAIKTTRQERGATDSVTQTHDARAISSTRPDEDGAAGTADAASDTFAPTASTPDGSPAATAQET